MLWFKNKADIYLFFFSALSYQLRPKLVTGKAENWEESGETGAGAGEEQ